MNRELEHDPEIIVVDMTVTEKDRFVATDLAQRLIAGTNTSSPCICDTCIRRIWRPLIDWEHNRLAQT